MGLVARSKTGCVSIGGETGEVQLGEAKRKTDALRRSMLAEMDLWMKPPTESERQLAAEIATLPVVTVKRPPREDILRNGMLPQECHQNCVSYCQLDPERKSAVVSGWWIKGDCFISHSVVERDGFLFCVTPFFLDEREFRFAPDPKIEWHEDGAGRTQSTRDGRSLELMVRANPENTIKQSEEVRVLLLKGMDPLKAWDLVIGKAN